MNNQPLPDNIIDRDGTKFIEMPLGACMMLRAFATKRISDLEKSEPRLIAKFGEEETKAVRMLNEQKKKDLKLFKSSLPKYLPNVVVYGPEHLQHDPKLKDKLCTSIQGTVDYNHFEETTAGGTG